MPAETHPDPVREEIVNYQNPLLFLKIWEIQSHGATFGIPEHWPWHYHREVEFLAVTEGSIGFQTKREYGTLERGDLVLFGSSQLHRVHKAHASGLTFIVFQIDLLQHFEPGSMPYLNAFAELTEPLGKLNYIFREQPAAREEAFSLILDIYRETQQRERGYELAISAAIKRLLLLLLRRDTKGYLQVSRDNDMIRLRPAIDYIELHLHEKIAVDDICRLLNLSYHYFIRHFHQVMGMSFVDYVNYKRIKKAERMLLTRDMSMTEIGLAVGIPSMGQFYKLFKRHNRCAPSEFRERMKQDFFCHES
ncbi:AraC family transcriptional regulator [Paenibacillus thalictri]|uniref:AraC family transcriptional regulator n=2 Tax=Paenibacillus thalictri TaxID=2527873 RepID=A0A4Q9DF32_9BACL|nr:AraC family transcriptional regulator [Paenibacillus thalictri]TBL70461.1 AraC family transcriptional regulator [Paenibacillus thalictri]